ncbi:putative Histone-lysine N-methyltransferase NSD2 [Daphnia magna]|uniref:Putative Histone-lysine N-methyltransferase NSD2 n=1 Tax=Daphnia magna TaxID=35525 RepID=A0A164V2D9_9CRUS|nr:putative Histone-lysine N-methyltransferase NSD2 [Daphnia magna]
MVSTIRSYVNLHHNDWNLHIPMATLAINSARQSTTKRSPFELVYGKTPVLSDSKNQSKRLLDPHRRNGRQYIKGDLVLVQRNIRKKGMTKKLLPKFIGPFEIVKRVCPTTNLVEDPPTRRKKQIWRRFNEHVAHIRPFRSPYETEWRPEDSESDTEDEYGAEPHDPPISTQKPNEPGINRINNE